jgi:hypothetical protein
MTVLVHGQDIRLANGSASRVRFSSKTDTGLVIQTPSGERTIECAQLSAGTRYPTSTVVSGQYTKPSCRACGFRLTNAPAAMRRARHLMLRPAPARRPVTEAAPAARLVLNRWILRLKPHSMWRTGCAAERFPACNCGRR